MDQDLSVKILSDIIVYMKYAKYDEKLKRRETWEEIVDRNKKMHLKKYPDLKDQIDEAYKYVYDKKIVPSMRGLQFSGKPIEINPVRLYNCSATAIDHPDSFSEIMFLLLSGSGVGYSVQKHHVKKLPSIKKPTPPKDGRYRKKRYLIGDSIEGWSDAIKVLMKSYFQGEKEIEFDYRDIRAKGERLITSGGKAPGPQPLKDCIHNIRKVLNLAIDDRGQGTKLKSIEVHDIVCYIADAVLSGGIRRSACISLFSIDDNDMLESKFGNWWELNPQRARANNSVVLVRHKINQETFNNLWEKIKASGCGEPAFFLTNDKNYMTNPCCEISLKSMGLCNLTSVNVSNVEDQEDFNLRCKYASFIGTLQAGYSDFHYLREEWKDNIEKEALIGVSMTGIASQWFLDNIDLKQGAKEVKKENSRVAKLIGINKSYRCTTVKPEGSSSLVMGTSSGIHAWHSPYYIRRLRVGKEEAIYQYLSIMHPEIIEDEYFKPDKQAIIQIPIKAPEGSIFRDESALQTLERVKKVQNDWIREGHRKGSNYHNVSCTISIKDDEWDEVGEWMWKNRDYYNGISVLPYDGGSYIQTPFEEISASEYDRFYKLLKNVNIDHIIEENNNVNHKDIIACGGGACEIK